MSRLIVQLRGMLSGDDASKEQIERQVLNIWDKMYKTWFAKVRFSFIYVFIYNQNNALFIDVLALNLTPSSRLISVC